MVFLESYLVSAFLLEPPYDFCSFNMHCIHLYTSPPPSSFLATNNFFPPILPSSIFPYALLLVCCSAVVLFLVSALLQVHKFNLSLSLSSIDHFLSFSIFIPDCLSSSTTLTTLLSSVMSWLQRRKTSPIHSST